MTLYIEKHNLTRGGGGVRESLFAAESTALKARRVCAHLLLGPVWNLRSPLVAPWGAACRCDSEPCAGDARRPALVLSALVGLG